MKRFIVPILIVLMWLGLLWSRALISVAMILFIVYALITKGKQGMQQVRSTLWLKGLLILFLLPLISGIWSNDHKEWWNVMQVKLPLLFFPFCLPVLKDIDRAMMWRLLWIFLGLLGVSMLLSLQEFYVMDTSEYLKAKLMKVAVYDDHVRYSWLLVIGYSWLLYEILSGHIRQKLFSFTILILFGIYIHVLAAKTGLIGFYLVNGIAILFYTSSKYKIVCIALLLSLPVIAWLLVPSFHNRLKFVQWDFQNYSRGKYVEGLSDAPRVLSWKAGVDIVTAHPVTGVGAGDIIAETGKWYEINAPFLKEYEQLVPANQILLYATYAGVLGGLLALLVFIFPLVAMGMQRNMLWICFHLVACIGFLYEIALEMQFGVFIYIFFGLLFYSRFSKES